ncbi:unnamed protein product [Candidula unifasciata]|uniref:Ig-like domain-containing protein n=1 Tax=Candidula unifasciata TaxID=100452 RepID=A0A8S3ZEW5_9EUPU|nr:unnamed protein product [Candidula unifasciata]
MHVLLQCCTVGLLVAAAVANLQSWSERSYIGRPHTFGCNSTLNNVSVSSDHILSWTRLGSDLPLQTDKNYELLADSGVANMSLTIRSVTSDMAGIYFCHIRNQSGAEVDRVVKGLNLAGPLYDDKFEEYKSNVIRGVISAASVFTFVVGICVIDRFKYLTIEQKQKRRERKEERARRQQQQQQAKNGGIDNLALEDGLPTSREHDGSAHRKIESNTHL